MGEIKIQKIKIKSIFSLYPTDQLVQCSEFNKPSLSHLVNIILLLASFSLDKKVWTMRLSAVKFVIPVTSALCWEYYVKVCQNNYTVVIPDLMVTDRQKCII